MYIKCHKIRKPSPREVQYKDMQLISYKTLSEMQPSQFSLKSTINAKVALDALSACFFDTLTLVLSSVPGEILPPLMGMIGKACIQRESELFPATRIGRVPVWFSLWNQESSSSLKLSLSSLQ